MSENANAEAIDQSKNRECKIALDGIYAHLLCQAGTIASLRKSNDEMVALIATQDYRIKQLEAQLMDQSTTDMKQTNAVGVAEVAKFESTEADEEDNLFEKMRQRKELLCLSPVSRSRAIIKDFAKKHAAKSAAQ